MPEGLTRNYSGITILTEDVANSWYGGLFGDPEAEGLDALDPLVAGHVHDGKHIDGHAQKINLTDHVTGELPGEYIKDGSITEDKLSPEVLEGCCALLIVTNDGRLVQDIEGNILLKDNP